MSQQPWQQQPTTYGPPPVIHHHINQPPPPYSALAVISLVAGTLWVFGVGSVAAVVTGWLGIRECDRTGTRGKGLAIAGIVLGGIGTFFLLLFWGMIGLESILPDPPKP